MVLPDYPRLALAESGPASKRRTIRAGLPATITSGGTSSKTAACIPTTELRPTRTPGAMKIKTPTAILGVRGTTFAVQVYGDH